MQVSAATLAQFTAQEFDSLADYWRSRLAVAWALGDIAAEAHALRVLHAILAEANATKR